MGDLRWTPAASTKVFQSGIGTAPHQYWIRETGRHLCEMHMTEADPRGPALTVRISCATLGAFILECAAVHAYLQTACIKPGEQTLSDQIIAQLALLRECPA